DAGGEGDARAANKIVSGHGRGAGGAGAMTLDVVRIAVVVVEVVSRHKIADQVWVSRVYARVQDCDGDPCTDGIVPCAGCADLWQMPGVAVVGIVRRERTRYLPVELSEVDLRVARQSRGDRTLRLRWHLDDMHVDLGNRVKPLPAMGPDDGVEIPWLEARSRLHQQAAGHEASGVVTARRP